MAWMFKTIAWWMWVILIPVCAITDLILHLLEKTTLSSIVWNYKGTEVGALIFFCMGGLTVHLIFGKSGNG